MRPQSHRSLLPRGFVLWLPMAVWVGWAAPSARGDTPVPPKKLAEQHTYDENAGTFVPTRDPIPGTEDGDLDITRQWMALEEYKTACGILKDWMKAYGPESPRYPEALYLYATAYLERGRYRKAHDAYQELLSDYPGSEYAAQALWGDFRIGEQYLAGQRRRAWGGLLRIRDYDGGLAIMDDFVVNYADTPLAEKAQMTKADYYYARGEYEMAEDEYATFAREYPRSRWQPRALLQSAHSALASFPGIKFDDAGLVEAQERFRQFQRLYPDTAAEHEVPVILDQIEATRADKTYDIAKFYEKTGQPRAARFYYRAIVRNWPDTPAAPQATGRLAALGEPVTSVGAEILETPGDGSPDEGGG